MPFKRKTKKAKTSKTEKRDSKISLWDNEDGGLGGYLNIRAEFLSDLLERYYEGDGNVVDSYDDDYVSLKLYVNESQFDDGPPFYGSVKVAE